MALVHVINVHVSAITRFTRAVPERSACKTVPKSTSGYDKFDEFMRNTTPP
eukprot:m.469129 g.469129  ORF g.469129 m.469129 type:complete len:51 (-) comp21649_c0_seq19:1131-1283(-)